MQLEPAHWLCLGEHWSTVQTWPCYTLSPSWPIQCGICGVHTLSSTYPRISTRNYVDPSWNVMAHGDAREGKWRGNWRMEWVVSTLHTNWDSINISPTWCKLCSLIYFTAKSFYMFRVTQHPSSGVLKTVTAASGTGHTVKYKNPCISEYGLYRRLRLQFLALLMMGAVSPETCIVILQ